MLPVDQKVSAAPICRAESPSETPAPVKWLHKHITQFPSEVLSHVFGCLGCDAIGQLQNTCRKFREEVRLNHPEVFFYGQLPKLFREQYTRSRSWQKWVVENGLHPFATKLPLKEKNILNSEHHAAVLCYHTLRNMMHTAEYRCEEVFSGRFCVFIGKIDFCSTNSTVSLFGGWTHAFGLLSQDGSGSWSVQSLKLRESSTLSLLDLTIRVCFNTNGRYLSLFTSANRIIIFKRDPDSGSWQLINAKFDNQVNEYVMSPSGTYVAVFSMENSIRSIMCFDDQRQWVPMPMAEGVRVDPGIKWVDFSQSEQRLAINYENKVVTLSLDSRGCWNFLWASDSDRCIDYAKFCSSGRWLLIAYKKSDQDDGSVEVVGLDPANKNPYRQTLSCKHRRVIFSPSGNYLASRSEGEQCLLWQLHKSGTKWVLCGSPGAAPLPALGTTSLKDIVKFSPCDNYLFVSSKDRAMEIWGRDEQDCWMIQSIVQHDGTVKNIEFSRTGVHALMVDRSSIHILGRDESGLWSVKGIIPDSKVTSARFHPAAEHLIVFTSFNRVRVCELRKGDSSGAGTKPAGATVV